MLFGHATLDSLIFTRFNRSALATTINVVPDMESAAIFGLNSQRVSGQSTPGASRNAITSYPAAHQRVCSIFRRVARLRMTVLFPAPASL